MNTLQVELAKTYNSRDEAIEIIRTALRRRSGKAWSVSGGRGTTWGWIRIAAPPARRTWSLHPKKLDDGRAPLYFEDFEDRDTGEPGHHTSPADREELAALLALETRVHHQGLMIPASSAYYREYIERAEGRPVTEIARPYWD